MRADEPGTTGEEDAVSLAVTLRNNDHETSLAAVRRGQGIGGTPTPAHYIRWAPAPGRAGACD
ncbi:hypothetical protein GCM10009827_014620 [Dactylosporangium maewongense]|uniref:Uncharacterized protein n=1 Tax=Dactylosporangium maewongense TaxID=634393 RepID=A0ABN1ZRS1_9ACTN